MSKQILDGDFGRLMLDVAGCTLSPQERELIARPVTGGVILFSRNFSSLGQLAELTKELKSIKPSILIAVDHEGGRVQRFREGFTRIPPMKKLGAYFRDDSAAAVALAEDIGWLMAAELRCFDIDFTFAPVLDVDVGVSSVIGDRSFSDNPEEVALLASALIRGMRDAGMASTGKHFPGHGAISADSHVDLPIDHRTLALIESCDIVPFARLLEEGIDSVMPAHVVYSQVDSCPAGFSAFWLQKYLRQKMGFKGVIFSDDLSMEGASVAGDITGRAEAALSAGCDMILVCNNPTGAMAVAQWMEGHCVSSTPRLARMIGKKGGETLAELQNSARWCRVRQSIELLNSSG